MYRNILNIHTKVILAFATGIFMIGCGWILVHHQHAIEALKTQKLSEAHTAAVAVREMLSSNSSSSDMEVTPYSLSNLQDYAAQDGSLIRVLNEKEFYLYIAYGNSEVISINTLHSSPHTPISEYIKGVFPRLRQSSGNALFERSFASSGNVYASVPLSNTYADDNTISLVVFRNLKPAIASIYRFTLIQLACWLLIISAIAHFAAKLVARMNYGVEIALRKAKNYSVLATLHSEKLERLTEIIRKSDNLMVLTDPDGKIVWLNESFTRKNNYSKEELGTFTGRELAEVSHHAPIVEVIHKVKNTGEKLTYETKSFDEENKVFWSSTTVTPILDECGRIEFLLFVDADITALKAAEEKIQKMADFDREDAKAAIRIEKDLSVSFSNKAGEKILKLWNVKIGETITKPSVCNLLTEALNSRSEKTINVACAQRIFKLRITPSADASNVHLFGEDITEAQQLKADAPKQPSKIEIHNLHLTYSMNYARRIQESILPGEDQLRKYFKNAFVLSMPKDILSGDFFWIYECVPQRQYLLALADCTGHGVPGAMLSIIGHSLLNEAADTAQYSNPAAILNTLNKEVIKTMRQKHGHARMEDGMDISLVYIDLDRMTLTFAGAYHPLFWMNGQLNVIKGDRYPIGGHHYSPEREFSNHHIQISPGDSIYLFSDGLTDQFGGNQNKKFQSARLKRLVEENHKYSMQAQSYLLRQAIQEWKGDNDQVDDIYMVGIKF